MSNHNEDAEGNQTEQEHQISRSEVPTRHSWRQRGAYLICDSCPNEHGTWVGSKYRLTGVDDDGQPILTEV
jgi:hypothetical protein